MNVSRTDDGKVNISLAIDDEPRVSSTGSTKIVAYERVKTDFKVDGKVVTAQVTLTIPNK